MAAKSEQTHALLADHDGDGRHASSSYPPSSSVEHGDGRQVFDAYAPHSPTLAAIVHNNRNLVRLVCFVLLIGVPFTLVSYNKPEAISTAHSMATEVINTHWPIKYDPVPEQCLPISQGTHTVACHIRNAQAKFKKMQRRQSRTYKQAVNTYVAQYQRQPPPGFREWFDFAKANNAPVIDDYGQIEKDLAPLRSVPAAVLRERMKHALTSNSNQLHWWKFANGNVTTSAREADQTVRVLREVMTPFLHALPPFTVLQNWDDVHKVCGASPGEEDATSLTAPFVYDQGALDAVKQLTRSCPRNTETESNLPVDRPSINVCTQAEHWRKKHGLMLNSGPCFITTVPMLSSSKVSSFIDILYPSWAYAAVGYRYGGPPDVQPFAEKKNVIYWRGSNTGGNAEPDHNRFGHRHRMVMLMQQFKAKAQQLEDGPTNLTRLAMPTMPTEFDENQMIALSRLGPDSFDINFSKLVQPEGDLNAAAWQKLVPVAQNMPGAHAYKHKFLFDLDGNAMSGRFYRLMESNSLVFKQTIFVEWHDDRIVPWLHYVPISLDMEEIPVLMDYFLHDPEGIKHGELLAAESKTWISASMRKIDLSIYMYRLLLELGHIIGHE